MQTEKWEMKTVSLFVWGSCFKTWIIHNHLGNLRWNVPPLYDQVSKVSRSRSRTGHRSHKLCCQPPPTPECLLWSAGRIIKVYSSHIIWDAPQSSVLTLTSWYWGTPEPGTRGRVPTTESPGERQQNLWGLGRIWPIRGGRWGQVTNRTPWPGGWGWPGVATSRDRDKSHSGSGSVSSGPPTTADTDRRQGVPWERNTWHTGTQTLPSGQSSQDQYKICELTAWWWMVMYRDQQKPDK